MQKQFRMTQNNPSPDFQKCAIPLPLAEQATNREVRQVCGIGELFVCDLKTDAFRMLPTNATGKAEEDVRESLAGAVGDKTQVSCQIPNEIIRCYRQPVFQQSRVA